MKHISSILFLLLYSQANAHDGDFNYHYHSNLNCFPTECFHFFGLAETELGGQEKLINIEEEAREAAVRLESILGTTFKAEVMHGNSPLLLQNSERESLTASTAVVFSSDSDEPIATQIMSDAFGTMSIIVMHTAPETRVYSIPNPDGSYREISITKNISVAVDYEILNITGFRHQTLASCLAGREPAERVFKRDNPSREVFWSACMLAGHNEGYGVVVFHVSSPR